MRRQLSMKLCALYHNLSRVLVIDWSRSSFDAGAPVRSTSPRSTLRFTHHQSSRTADCSLVVGALSPLPAKGLVLKGLQIISFTPLGSCAIRANRTMEIRPASFMYSRNSSGTSNWLHIVTKGLSSSLSPIFAGLATDLCVLGDFSLASPPDRWTDRTFPKGGVVLRYVQSTNQKGPEAGGIKDFWFVLEPKWPGPFCLAPERTNVSFGKET